MEVSPWVVLPVGVRTRTRTPGTRCVSIDCEVGEATPTRIITGLGRGSPYCDILTLSASLLRGQASAADVRVGLVHTGHTPAAAVGGNGRAHACRAALRTQFDGADRLVEPSEDRTV